MRVAELTLAAANHDLEPGRLYADFEGRQYLVLNVDGNKALVVIEDEKPPDEPEQSPS